MTSKIRYLRGARKPSMVGRGTVTVKREVLGQKRSENSQKPIQKSSNKTTNTSLNK